MVKGAGIEYGASFLHIILQFVGLFVFRKKTATCYLQLFSLFSKATKCAHFEGRKIVIWQLVFKVPESDTLGLLWWWWRCGALLMGNSEQLECSMSSGDYKFAHYSVWISFQQPDCCFEKHEVIKGTFCKVPTCLFASGSS